MPALQDRFQIIPRPARLALGEGRFRIDAATSVRLGGPGAELERTAAGVVAAVGGCGGPPLAIRTGGESAANEIVLSVAGERAGGDESYRLRVEARRIALEAPAPAGLFYALQTFEQLLPASAGGGVLDVPCVSIDDAPRFVWRGLHLDVSRHFMPVDFVKRYIDAMAMHKMNVFHWHLTDDQGWRIEIGKYPRLTEVGAWRRGSSLLRAAGKERYGGFYSQADVREIVDFAAARHVTIVPEIEMPGHSQAAIAAYPERGCTGEAVEVLMQMGVSPFLYNVEEETFAFLEDVLSEVMELFPGPYIHIGGDEAIKDQWRASPRVQERMRELAVADEDALQSYFIERIGRFLNQRGRKLVGWDEILEGGLPADATVMSWRGFDGGIAAARLGHDVVMTPYSHCYLDHYQGDPDLEAPALGRPIPLRTAYDFEPLPPQLTAAQAGRVLGGQGNLWTEFVESTEHAEYMAFPRACALAEVLWSPASSRDWPDFARRLEIHLERLRRSGIGFSRSAYQVTFRSDETGEEDRFRITMTNELGKTDLRYTTDESDPTSASHRYLEPLEVSAPATIKAAVFDGPRRIGAVSPLRVASCWSETIDAARFDRTDRAMTVAVALDQAEAGERQLVVGFAGCYVAYDRVDLSGVERVVAEVGVAPEHTRGGSIELRLGKTRGPLLACLPVPVPVDDRGFVRIEAAVAAAAGVQRLCVLFRNEEAGENDLVALLASLRLVRADKS